MGSGESQTIDSINCSYLCSEKTDLVAVGRFFARSCLVDDASCQEYYCYNVTFDC